MVVDTVASRRVFACRFHRHLFSVGSSKERASSSKHEQATAPTAFVAVLRLEGGGRESGGMDIYWETQ